MPSSRTPHNIVDLDIAVHNVEGIQNPQLLDQGFAQLLLFFGKGSPMRRERVSFVLLGNFLQVCVLGWLAELHRELHSTWVPDGIVAVHAQEGRADSEGGGQFGHEDLLAYFLEGLVFCFFVEFDGLDGIADPIILARIYFAITALAY